MFMSLTGVCPSYVYPPHLYPLPYVCLSVYLSICRYIRPCVRLHCIYIPLVYISLYIYIIFFPVFMSPRVCICPCVCPSVYILFIYMSPLCVDLLHAYVSPCICHFVFMSPPCIYPSVCVTVRMYVPSCVYLPSV